MISRPVSISVRLGIPALLFLFGAYAMLLWNASCGFTVGENLEAVKNGRACGTARSGVAILLPFTAFLPALTRSPQRFYSAVAAVLTLNLMVVFALAPGA